MQGLSGVIGALGRNPLPDAFVVTSKEDIAGELGKLPGVASVQADAVWARRLAAAASIAELAVGLLAALLGAALVAVTFNTIRLRSSRRRDEIEVSKLLGATDAFIGRRFYYLACARPGGRRARAGHRRPRPSRLLSREVRVLAESYGSNFRFAFLPLSEALRRCSFWPAALGWLGAWLSVSRHLRAIEPR